jgi:hypothetical protein
LFRPFTLSIQGRYLEIKSFYHKKQLEALLDSTLSVKEWFDLFAELETGSFPGWLSALGDQMDATPSQSIGLTLQGLSILAPTHGARGVFDFHLYRSALTVLIRPSG